MNRRHPLGVYPLGNALLDPCASARRASGLGCLRRSSDEEVLAFLRCVDPEAVGKLSGCSTTCRAFCCLEELWREHCLRWVSSGGRIRWSQEGTWCATYVLSVLSRSRGGSSSRPATQARVYSDVLHRPFFFAAVELDPSWLSRESIARVDARRLTTEEFVSRFERKSTPVLLEGGCEDWPAMKTWSRETLTERFGDAAFACGPCDLSLREWYAYANNNMDDVPLFVFDRFFQDRAPGLLKDYEVPKVFRGRDLFDHLGERRPAFRWLLAGNKRSGSKWHIDPNKTCAWNGVVRGRKRWVMLPPGCSPPGVQASKDGTEVTQPLSLIEWYSNFYKELRECVEKNPAWDLKEVTCGPGDVVFIPCGWWHCVLNLDDDTLAVTQNYCSETHLHSVRRFLWEKRHDISGAAMKDSLPELFDEALARHRPELIAERPTAPLGDPACAGAGEPAEDAAGAKPSCGFSFWDHLRTTGKPLQFGTSRPTDGDPPAKRSRS